jgi:hypothetical protein
MVMQEAKAIVVFGKLVNCAMPENISLMYGFRNLPPGISKNK